MTPGPNNDSPEDVRFVVLRHTDQNGDHFDLMIEQGSQLATWKLPQAPETVESVLACQRIFDHRLIFLDYEGPLSGNKGSVIQHDKGHCRILHHSGDEWHLLFHGRHLTGRFDLVTEPATELSGPNQPWLFRVQS